MSTREKNIAIYKLAEAYLYKHLPNSITKEAVQELYFTDGDNKDYKSLNDVFSRFIYSAQNYQRAVNVINYDTNKKIISEILFDLDYKKILDEYTVEELFCKFKENEDLRVNDTKNKNNNTWHKWANSIIDSAKFISRFNSINEFASLVKSFDYCILSRAALAYLLAGNIKNIGFTLACDALKELGFSNYCKPDTHIIKICSELKLCKNTELDVFETVTKIAEDNNVSPYRVDKIFWLISSGNYYKNKNIKKKRLSEEFISLVKKELQI